MSKSNKAHLNELYKNPLPLPNVVPLPPLSLDPLSILLYIYGYLFPRIPKHARLRGSLNEETSSVWITDPASSHTLWTSGFFGKGQFSRSEPSWYIRTQRALGLIGKDEKLTSEEITARRRIARAGMKAERAKREKEVLMSTLREEGLRPHDPVHNAHDDQQDGHEIAPSTALDEVLVDGIPNIEYLQLTLHEALFLSLGLDQLDICEPGSEDIILKSSLLHRFSSSTPETALERESVDTTSTGNAFLVQYAVYHHYRSLGWVVKPGIKFGVDWLLYKRGPVFSHAEFSIVVIPSPILDPDSVSVQDVGKPWWWVHTLSRVNGQVKKTVILVFVEFHEEQVRLSDMTLGNIMGRYRVREVSLRRWVPSRNRD